MRRYGAGNADHSWQLGRVQGAAQFGKSLEGTIERGVEQTLGYMKKCGAAEGHLVLFDRREETQGKTPGQDEAQSTDQITVWTM